MERKIKQEKQKNIIMTERSQLLNTCQTASTLPKSKINYFYFSKKENLIFVFNNKLDNFYDIGTEVS